MRGWVFTSQHQSGIGCRPHQGGDATLGEVALAGRGHPGNWLPVAFPVTRGYIFIPGGHLGSASQRPPQNTHSPWPQNDHPGVGPGVSCPEARSFAGKRAPGFHSHRSCVLGFLSDQGHLLPSLDLRGLTSNTGGPGLPVVNPWTRQGERPCTL